MTRTGATMTSTLTVPLVGLGVLAVSQSIKIEKAWNEVRATYNATPREIEKLISSHGLLGKAVDQLSTKYGINRVEVIELLGKLSQMGYTGKKATAALTQGLEFAIAAGIPLEEGLQTTITLISTFGLSAKAMTQVLRGLNVIENDTAANGEDLAIALRRAGGNAQALVNPAFSAKDAIASIAAAMAVFKANGQETFRSANALRAIFQRLYSGGPKVNEFFKKMGVSVEGAKHQLKPFPQLMREIGKNWDKLTPKEQIEFMRSSIGIEFSPLFRLLVSDIQKGQKGMSIFENSLKSFGNTAKGTTQYQRELEIRSNSLAASFGRVRAAFQKVVDQPGVRKAFKQIADLLTDVAQAFSNASPKTQKWITIIGIAVAVLGPILVLLGALVAAVSAIGGTALAAVAGVVALGVAFVAFMKKGGPVQDFVKDLAGYWLKALKGAWTDLKDAVISLMPTLKILGAILGGVILLAITVLVSAIRGLAFIIKWLAIVVNAVVMAIVGFFKWLYNVLVGHSIIPDLINAIIALFNMLAGPVKAVVKAIVDFVAAAWNWIKGVSTTIWNGITGLIKAQLNLIAGIVKTVITGIRGTWNTVWTAIKAFSSAIWNAIVTVIKTQITVAKNLLSAVMNAIRGNWSGAWNNIKSAASAVMNGIRSIVSGFVSAIRSTISSGMSAVRSTWSSAWSTVRNTVSSIASTIRGIVNGLVGSVRSAFNSISSTLGKISSAASKVRNAIGFNKGGLVPGTGNRDTVSAMLTPGEYVLTKKAVRRIGLANLNRLQNISGGDTVLDALGGSVSGSLDGLSGVLTGRVTPDAAVGLRASISANLRLPDKIATAVGGNEVTVEFNTIVNNPIAEKASDSVNRRLAKTAQLGLIDTALSGALS